MQQNLGDLIEGIRRIGDEKIAFSRRAVETMCWQGRPYKCIRPTSRTHPTPQPRNGGTNPDQLGTEQRTTPEGFSLTEIRGADTARCPAPPIEQLTAHPYFETEQEEFDRHLGERGEENQDPEDMDHP
ncbi:hypothetical protein [Glutamicibacter nicotianae]|uniref:hypothetical protein n=1 Tax=Glutamicibacter nicotianae TaxID=37929 RepID=UPI00195D3366|nr:hypothetical protein [Glutamicibacter nicotianae]MBM7766821.1 hypothetical protein [Glutamicibacter nicotianae]